jgi:hypothetical protein
VQIAAEFRAGDIVIHSSRFSCRPMQYYLGNGVAQVLLVDADAGSPRLLRVIGHHELPSDTAMLRRVWLVLFPDFQQPGVHLRVLEWMDQHHARQQVVINQSNLFVALYERRDATLVAPRLP